MSIVLTVCKLYKKKCLRKFRRKRFYSRPENPDWLYSGYHQKVFKQIKEIDEEQFFLHNRMTKEVYELLLTLVKASLRKDNEYYLKKCIPISSEIFNQTAHFLSRVL